MRPETLPALRQLVETMNAARLYPEWGKQFHYEPEGGDTDPEFSLYVSHVGKYEDRGAHILCLRIDPRLARWIERIGVDTTYHEFNEGVKYFSRNGEMEIYPSGAKLRFVLNEEPHALTTEERVIEEFNKFLAQTFNPAELVGRPVIIGTRRNLMGAITFIQTGDGDYTMELHSPYLQTTVLFVDAEHRRKFRHRVHSRHHNREVDLPAGMYTAQLAVYEYPPL